MTTVVVYESFYGNTEVIARAVARGLGGGSVDVRSIAETGPLPAGIDLLVVGGPTYAHGVERDMRAFLDKVPPGSLDGVPATAFDTRLRWPRILSGAASDGIARSLEHKGARIIVDPESFLVHDKDGPLLDGEEARAEAWGRHVAATLERAA